MEKHIAFLLGSGFSVPSGLPTTNTLNSFVIAEIYNRIRASFKEEHDGLLQSYILEKVLLECDNSGAFNYEQYYDFLKREQNERLDVDKLLSFIERGMFGYFWACSIKNNICSLHKRKQIKTILNAVKDKCDNYLEVVEKLIDEYQRIIAEKLLGHTSNGKLKTFNPCYDGFIQIVTHYLDQGYIIDIYTLNHDLFLESLFELKGLQDKLCNGFGDDIQKINNKKYRTFNINNYDNYMRLYKLHGSIDMYELSSGDQQDPDYIQIIDGYSDKNSFLIDVEGEKYGSLNPLFLTGRSSKGEQYGNEPYKSLLSEFEKNIGKTEKLIVIGYSGNDNGINDRIYNNYTNWQDAYVVDYQASNHPYVTDKRAMPIKKGIEAFSVDDLR